MRASSALLAAVLTVAGFGLLLGEAAGSETGGPPASLAKLYTYDTGAPLAVREGRVSMYRRARVIELSYAGTSRGRVPASLVLPPIAPGERGVRVPAVLMQHGAGGSRADFLSEAAGLAHRGLAVLLIEAPMNRPPFPNWAALELAARRVFIQNVVDWRRGIDLLEARADVDADRLVFVGHSYGGTIAGIMAGVEPRLDGVIVMAGPARMSDFLVRTSTQGMPRRERAKRQGQLKRYLAHMSAIDGVRYVPYAAMPMLFQFGRSDHLVTRGDALSYYRAAPRAKRIVWYPAGHGLDEKARADREAWLVERLQAGR